MSHKELLLFNQKALCGNALFFFTLFGNNTNYNKIPS